MARGALIDAARSAGGVLRHVRSDVKRAATFDERISVVGLVGADGLVRFARLREQRAGFPSDTPYLPPQFLRLVGL